MKKEVLLYASRIKFDDIIHDAYMRILLCMNEGFIAYVEDMNKPRLELHEIPIVR